MIPKTCLLFIALLSAVVVHAQDKVYRRSGDVIVAKIKSVDLNSVTYQRMDNLTGPDYVISKDDIDKIVYQNGSVDVFNSRSRRMFPPPPPHHHRKISTDTAKLDYRTNIITVAPLQFSENGLGFGIGYEKGLDRNGIVAFYVPLIATFSTQNTYDNTTGQNIRGNQDYMIYVMPGIKIYPTSSNGVCKYAIGPSLVAATGQKTDQSYNGYTGTYTNGSPQTHTFLGVVVNNSLNINPGPRWYLGIEFGFGFTYLNTLGGVNQGTTGLTQGSFKVGYRF